MSAWSLTPTDRRHQVAPAPRRGLAGTPLTSALVGSLLAATLASCSSDATGTTRPKPTTSAVASPAPPTTPVDEQSALLAQYKKFWATLASVSRLPEDQRQPALSGLAVDPALKSLLAGMRANDVAGEVFYGAHIPNPQPVPISPDGMTALVNDCQNSTKTGLAARSTLKPKTRGVPRNHVNVTMKRTDDGQWKIAFIAYTKTPC